MDILGMFYKEVATFRQIVTGRGEKINIYFTKDDGYKILINGEVFYKIQSLSEEIIEHFKHKTAQYLKSA